MKNYDVTKIQEASQNGVNSHFSSEEAKAMLDADKQRRTVLVSEGLKSLLEQHNCRLDVFVILRQGAVEPNISIVAND